MIRKKEQKINRKWLLAAAAAEKLAHGWAIFLTVGPEWLLKCD